MGNHNSGGSNRTSDAKVAMMKRLRALGWTADEVARELGVCRDTVYRRTKEKAA